MSSTFDTPRLGPNVPWISASTVLVQEPLQDLTVSVALATQMAVVASNICYRLSRRMFTGLAGPVTVRPLARPTDVDTRFGYWGGGGAGGGYLNGGQFAGAYGQQSGGVNYFGSSKPSEVELGGFPIVQILAVKIDGVVIPPNEYYVQNRRVLVRARASASAEPTERWGWPMAQNLALPDTQENTFSVRYLYGVAPPEEGVLAATTLATQLVLNAIGEDNSLPQRVTSITRQGVSVAVVDVMDFFSRGLTGIWEVDAFIEAVNPTKAKLPGLAWSPDVGRPRRMPPSFS
jgi:hypothetical protein